MSDRKKEFQIVVEGNKTFAPGDQIKGHISVHSTKSIDVQHISLCLKCNAEIQGDRKVLLETIVFLASPKTSRSPNNVLTADEIHRFPFTFTLSEDLPGTLKIPKIASIIYTLTAIHKKPLFKLSPTLPTQIQEIQVERVVDVTSDAQRKEKKQTTQFGHIIGSKETEWSTIIPRTGFYGGESIPVSVDIRYFPSFSKNEVIRISLLKLINKMEPFKIVEKTVLASKTIDLDTTKNPSQNITVTFDIPIDTPTSLFPPNGQIMSIQYIIESELYLKGVKKSFIKAKKVYTHENVIVIGTTPKKIDPLLPVRDRKLTDSMYMTPSRLTSVRTVENKPSMVSMKDTMSSSRGSVLLHNSDYDTLRPLKRLDLEAPLTYTYRRRSTKVEFNEPNLPMMFEKSNKYTQSVPNSPRLMKQEKEEPPCLPMLISENTHHYPATRIQHNNTPNKPFDPRPIEHQDSFHSYNSFSDDSRSPDTPGPLQYFNSNEVQRPPPHPIHYPNSNSLQYREQITGTSVPHEYSQEDLEIKQYPRTNTPDLSRNNTLSTVSTHSTTGHYQKPR